MFRSRKAINRTLAFSTALALSMTACSGAGNGNSADPNYPSHPVDWIVPYEPGGGSDTQVRRLQPHVEKALGERINIVYKPGGDGAAGWEEMHSARPDGYTIGNVVSPNIMQLAITGKTGFKATDFEYVTWTEAAPSLIAVGKNSEYKSMEEFVEEARANPGKVTIAGVGETNKVDVQQIEQATGTKLTYTPVSGGSGPITQQLQGGHVDAAIESTSGILERSDALKPLAIAGSERAEAMPNTPTFDELGYEGWEDISTWGVIAPPGTPDSIVKKLNKAMTKAVQKPKIRKSMEEGGLLPLTMSPDEATKRVKKDLKFVEKEEKLAKSSG